MLRSKHLLSLLTLIISMVLLGSCYNGHTGSHLRLSDTLRLRDTIPMELTQQQQDSIRFAQTHHYTINFNFVVKGDSLMLYKQQPEEIVSQMHIDSFAVHKGQRLVVADIRIMPADSIDSVWVQVASDQYDFGWTHESKLLKKVDPDDPISQFISTFSNQHLLIFLIIISLVAVGYIFRKILKGNARIVHFNDIHSFYPTLLTLIVATSATFYASIQMFAPDAWQEFYFHPSLNPFSQTLPLKVFLILVWAMLIVALAAIDDTRHQLKANDTLLYLCGLAGMCAVDYIVFSISTLYYVGYLLLIIYIWYAMKSYYRHSRNVYFCGNCGAELHRKGRCPYCGKMNE